MKLNFKRWLPYLVAISAFALLCIAYFAPQFAGKRIVMHDIVQYEGSVKDIDDHYEKYGEDPQWTGNSFSGMPSTLISQRYDSQILKRVVYPVAEFLGQPASLIFIAMAGFFVMLLLFGINPWVSMVPALAYGLSAYFFIIIGAGHITKMIALAYAPLVVGGVYYTLRRNMWLGAALTALFASLQIAANHPQITYYFAFVVLALWVNEGVRAYKEKLLPRFAKATGMLAVAAVLALGSNFAPLWYMNEYSKSSMRGGTELTQRPDGAAVEREDGLDLDYVTAWSYGVVESFNMFIPNLYGGSTAGGFKDNGTVAKSLSKYGQSKVAPYLPGYWGGQPMTAGPTYLGAVAIFLAVMAMFLIKRRNYMWVAAVSVLALMLSWGHNFMPLTKLFFYHFPMYHKFRAVAMILVVLEWSVPFLAALGLAKLWRRDEATKLEADGRGLAGSAEVDSKNNSQLINALKYSFVITAGVALVFWLFGGIMFDFSNQYDSQMGLPDDVVRAMQQEREEMMKSDAMRSLVFVVLSAAAVGLYAIRKINRAVLVVLLGVLVCADMVFVNMRYLPQAKFEDVSGEVIKPTEADKLIMQDKTLGYRVLNLSVSPFNDATTSYFHRSVGGYHGAKLQRYQDVIEWYLSRKDQQVMNMLNTKYIIKADRSTRDLYVETNKEANGAAWFVGEVKMVNGADEEIKALGEIDTKRTAVVDERFKELLTGADYGERAGVKITLGDYKPNHLVYRYSAEKTGVAVFSEVYYDKGWTAYIDGKQAPHFRANYILRGMVLPAGEHTVEFRFRAVGFDRISALTLMFSVMIVLFVAGAVVAEVLRKRKKATL